MNKKKKIVIVVFTCFALLIAVLLYLIKDIIYHELFWTPGTEYDRRVDMDGVVLHETEIEKLIEEITAYAFEIGEGVRLNSVMFYVNREEMRIEACNVQYKMKSIDEYRGSLEMNVQLQDERWEFIRVEIKYYEGEYQASDLNVKDVVPTLEACIAYLQDNQFSEGNYSHILVMDEWGTMDILKDEGENRSYVQRFSFKVKRNGEKVRLELEE